MDITKVTIEYLDGGIDEFISDTHSFTGAASGDEISISIREMPELKHTNMLEVASYIMNHIYHEFDIEFDESLTIHDGHFLQDFDPGNNKQKFLNFLKILKNSGINPEDVQCVKAEQQLKLYEDYNDYVYVLRIKDRYFQFNGIYCSYEGLNISLDDPKEVFPFQRTVTEFSSKPQ